MTLLHKSYYEVKSLFFRLLVTEQQMFSIKKLRVCKYRMNLYKESNHDSFFT